MVANICDFIHTSRLVLRNEVKREVELKKGKLECPCKDHIYYGIPCRHQITIFLQKKCQFCHLPFNKRWLLKWFNTEEDPQEIKLSNFNQEVIYFILYLIEYRR